MKNVTYQELKTLVSTKTLTKGELYRIVNFETAERQHCYANHQFDIVVKATSSDRLSPNARALHHAGDTYFKNNKLNKWRIKYSLNGKNCDWTARGEVNKGVIYYLKDEFGNAAGYDFKNILFSWYFKCCYTFSTEEGEDASLNGSCNHNIIGAKTAYGKRTLNDNLFLDFCTYNELAANTSCNYFGKSCSFNKIGKGSRDNEFMDFCHNNELIGECRDNTFKEDCSGNIVHASNRNAFNRRCQNNELGYNCVINTFEEECHDNDLSNYCAFCRLEKSASWNKIGCSCSAVRILERGCHNTIKCNSKDIDLGRECYSNIIHENCIAISLADGSKDNTVEEACEGVSFGKDCRRNDVASGTRGLRLEAGACDKKAANE